MSKDQILRSVVGQRLTAAGEDVFGMFEGKIAELEEELSRTKEEHARQRKLLDAVFKPEVRIQRLDVQQLLVIKEEVPPQQQQWSSSLKQEDPEPPHVKGEQEDPEPTRYRRTGGPRAHTLKWNRRTQPPHVKVEQEDPEPPHVKVEQEDPEPPHVKVEQEDPEPPHVKVEQEDPAPTR